MEGWVEGGWEREELNSLNARKEEDKSAAADCSERITEREKKVIGWIKQG